MLSRPGFDREARITRLIHTHEAELLRLCTLFLKDFSLAQDAVQETFIKAYQHLDSFRSESTERTWLMRIAVNTCKDLRRTGWSRHIDQRVDIDNLPQPVAPPSAEHLALMQAILALPEKLRDAVLLHCDQGLTVRETAKVLGVTAPAVCNRLTKARAILKDALEGDDDL